jgi:hypothetical protein
VEARRFTLPSDMPPRICDEVEERSPDAERGHCATVSSRSARVKCTIVLATRNGRMC